MQLCLEHIYIHVPFCPTICPYCDFHVLERRAQFVPHFLNRLAEEALALASLFPAQLKTVYVGGGTPSFLRDHELVELVKTVRQHFGWPLEVVEATIEVNPGTIDRHRAHLWRELGFNRASLGVQSLQENVLRFLGRNHTKHQALEAIEILVNEGFEVSCDLITAVPGQDLEKDLHALGELELKHISAYTLTIEEGTPFAHQKVVVDEDIATDAFLLTRAILADYGLEAYEVSNHAVSGHESRHNLAYWEQRFWLALGPSATGHYPAANWPGSTSQYAQAANEPISVRVKNRPFAEWLAKVPGICEPVSGKDFVTDALFAGLRLHKGIDLANLEARSGIDIAVEFARPLSEMIDRGWLEMKDTRLRATSAGLLVLNRIIEAFL